MEAATLPGRRTAAPALRHRADRVRAAVLGRPELPALLALAALLNLWALSRNGFANEYYAAAVRSMGSSWHAFIFGSFDPSGVMTVDKPPLASWVQVASTKVFGYGSWGILLPQAIMGVITVGLVYDLTRRLFGRPAGAVAGLVLALTPMTVAISRHNNPDALLVLCSVAAVWLLVRALQDPRRATRLLVLSGVAVGLGFETKMAVALMVVPGIVAAWLWVRPDGLRRAVAQVAAFTGSALVVGGAWPLLMLLTPAADRPWVSGTSDNSILSLIFGYNGLGRLDGQAGGPGGMAGGPGGGGGPGGAGGPFGGPTGPFRLLEQSLGGQAGWLIGAALVGGLGVVAASRLRRTDVRSGWIICVGGAFLTAAVAFSTAKGIFHPYYVSLLAPFTASLVGAVAGFALRGDVRGKALGAGAVLAGMVTTMVVLHHQPGQFDAIKPLLVTGSVVAAIALATSLTFRWRAALLGAALALLLMAPATWAVQTLGHATQGTFPAGGPADAGGGFGGPGGGGPPGGGMRLGGRAGFGGPPPGATTRGGAGGGGMFGGDGSALTSAARYAKAHGGGTVVTASQSGASMPIISSDANVAAIGGFSGRESQVTTSWLAGEVRDGRIRWVLSDGQGGGFGGPDGRVGATKVMSRVQSVCTPVSSQTGLYDCAGKAAAIAGAGS